MPVPSPHAATLLERLDGVVVLDLVVASAAWRADELREFRLTGSGTTFAHEPGQDVMLGVEDPSGRHRWRRYTIRASAPDDLTLWITTDANGPGAGWARTAAPGTRVEAIGPRGKIRVRADAELHVFVVDEAGIAAALSMSEALRVPAAAHVVAPGELGELVGASSAAPRFTELPPSSPGGYDADELGVILRDAAVNPADVAAYAFGELRLVRDARDVFLASGLDEDHVATKAYWRADRSNEPHGEPAKPSE